MLTAQSATTIMAEKKGPVVSPNKLAMSRALGAAFLNHQVEQLEKSVSSPNGTASGNWRRRQPMTTAQVPLTNGNTKRPPMAPGIKVASRRPGEESQAARKNRAAQSKEHGNHVKATPLDAVQRKSSDEEKEDKKEADVVVVDASVLVHALYQVRKWCRDGREEVVIVPLEALNTLDLLKKGTSPLAQRARAASRVLEAQVGANPRIRVQQDDAFVLWDSIAFNNVKDNVAHPSPEWVRRTICCAQWEAQNGSVEAFTGAKTPPRSSKPAKVVLAVISSSAASDLSTSLGDLKLSPSPTPSVAPVPLPAPHLHAHKHEPRCSGSLVTHWAARAHIDLLYVDPSSGSGDDDVGPRSKRTNRPRKTSDGGGGTGKGHHGHGGGLVERPPAVMAMMEMVSQPSKVVRVLARGEKLDPDP